MNDVRKIVNDNLDNAAENGEFAIGGSLYRCTALEIACDLCDKASDCEDFAPADLCEYIRDWKVRNGVS